MPMGTALDARRQPAHTNGQAGPVLDMKSMQALIDKQAAEIAALKARSDSDETKATPLKIGEKGTLVLRLGGRWPMSLYSSQACRLAREIPRILDFIEQQAIEGNLHVGDGYVPKSGKLAVRDGYDVQDDVAKTLDVLLASYGPTEETPAE